jgi:hypothetical protein
MGHILIGQTFITNTSPIDDTRYSEYDGSPYFFKDNKSVDLYLTGDDKPYNVVLNINLHEKEVEVFRGNEFAAISLNEIESINAGELGVISSVNGNIWIEHFKDYKYHLVNNPKMSIRETTTNLPGEIVEKKTFIIKNDYTLSMGGESHSIKMKKKSIVSVLGKEADKTAKKTKNKLKSVNDLVLLLTTLTSM